MSGGQTTGERQGGCLDRLRAASETLTGARLHVVTAILEDPWAVRGLAITALAERLETSENAISRLTQSLGYSGYREFMNELVLDLGKSVGYPHLDASAALSTLEADDELGVVHRVMNLELQGLQDAAANVDLEQTAEVVRLLAGARTILLLGTGTAAGLCQVMAYRLASIGCVASATSDPMVMLTEAHRLGEDDVAVILTFSGASRDSVLAAQHARQRGARVVAVTSERERAVSAIADITLNLFSASLPRDVVEFCGRVAALTLIEALATAVSEQCDDSVRGSMAELGELQTRLNTLPPGWRP